MKPDEEESLGLLGQEIPPKASKFQLFVILCFGIIGGFLFGYDTGVISGALLLLKKDFHLSSFDEELVVALALAGAILGSIVSGPIADRFGRRPVIFFSALLFIVGSGILGFSSKKFELFCGRFVVGSGIGIAANIVPVFVAEISPPEIRGALVTANNLATTAGQLISYLVDSAFVHVPQGWRYMLAFGAIPAIIQAISIILGLLPESPRWLVSVGREQEAEKILSRIRGLTNTEPEIREIQAELEMENNSSWMDLLKRPALPALILGIMLQVFQQFCGINTAMYYSATILKLSGEKSDSAAIWFSDAVAFTNALFTIVAIFLIDRVGRRILLLTSIVGVFFGLSALGLSFFLSEHYIPKFGGYMALASLVLYVAFFAIGLGPIPWTVNAEIFHTSVSGKAMGISTSANWIANLIISISFLSYIDLVGAPAAFWTYAGIAVAAFVYFYIFLPETAGKTFDEIQAIWIKKPTSVIKTE